MVSHMRKKKLIKDGKIKKDIKESYIFKGEDNCYYEKIDKNKVIKLENLPFEIPKNWSWIKLSSFCDIYTGDSINENDKNKLYRNRSEGYDYIGTKDVNFNHTIVYENGVKIPYDTQFKICPKSKILLCIEGGSAGRKIAFTSKNVCFGNKLACFNSWIIDDRYLYLFLQSPLFLQLFKDKLTGIISGVSINNLKQLFLPLPPLEEQERIVKKFKSCEPLLSRYELIEQNITLLETSLEEKLKTSILQYAIEGKLVKQDPNDEPASVLLERIKAEKEKLISEGKIKRDKNDSIIVQSDDKNYYDNQDNLIDVPLEIPDNWLWCYLPTIASFSLGKTPERNNDKYWNNGAIPWVSISDLYDKKTINSSKEKVSVSAIIDVFKNIIVSKGTLLMSFKLTIGKTSILGMDAVHNEAIISIVPYYDKNYFIRDYLLNFLSILCQFIEQTSAIKGNTLNKEKLKRMLIPLPPECQIYKINDTLKRLFSFIES